MVKEGIAIDYIFYLQETITSDETLQAKRSFEQLASEMGVKIKHYHADNGRFADRDFINDAQQNNQRLTYWCKLPLSKWHSSKTNKRFTR